MRVTMLLADAAQAVGGKLYVLGGGWSVIGPAPSPMAIAIKIDVPWGETDVPHRWALDLIDQDGWPVRTSAVDADPVRISGEFQVGRPAEVAVGTPIDVPLAINVGPLALPQGSRCVWQLTIDGVSEPDWRLAFDVRPAP